MSARFILSLDCEGKWGVADHLSASDHIALSDDGLRRAYGSIIALLEKYNIPATFAFTACFTLDKAGLVHIRPQLEALAQHFPDYINPVLQDCFHGSQQGWAGNWAVEAVKASRVPHEIGLHGVTHIPWDHPRMTEEWARRDLDLGYEDCNFAKPGMTYICPRGGLGYEKLLAEKGIVGYRLVRKHASRIRSLLSEFDITSAPDADPAYNAGLQEIPAGYFINWRHGLRNVVPVAVTRLRAKRMLQHAAHSNGVVHFWTHPENIATAPDTLNVMEAILQEVASARATGQCRVITQLDYCNERRAQVKAAA